MDKAMKALHVIFPSAGLQLNRIPAYPRPDFRNILKGEHYNSMLCDPCFS